MAEHPMRWQDPRDSSWHDIRVRADIPGDGRSRQRQMGNAWLPMKELLTRRGFGSQNVRMGANGYRNESYFIKDDDIWILFGSSPGLLGRLMVTATPELMSSKFDRAEIDRILRSTNEYESTLPASSAQRSAEDEGE